MITEQMVKEFDELTYQVIADSAQLIIDMGCDNGETHCCRYCGSNLGDDGSHQPIIQSIANCPYVKLMTIWEKHKR